MSGRRGFLASAAAMVAAGTVPTAAHAKLAQVAPVSPDADLLALCADFADWAEALAEAEADLSRLPPGYTREEHDVLWAAMEEVSQGWNDCHDEIAETQATTLAGLKAKAAVLRASLQMYANDVSSVGLGEAAEPHERLAWSMAYDLVEMAGEAS